MKKIIVPVFILSIITWSCNKENSTPVQVEETTGWHTVTLNASVDSEITKTAYAGDKTFSWSEGDQISVLFHNGDVDKFFTFTAAAGNVASTSFSGSVLDGYVIGSSDGGAKYALYPASDNHVYDATKTHKIMFHIPAETDFTAPGAHYSSNIPMFATGDGDNYFAFTPIAGAYKFTFKVADGVSKVKIDISQASSYYYTGNFPYRMSDGFIAFESRNDQGSNMLRRTTMIASVESNFVSFYMPYRYAAGIKSPTVKVYNADNDYILYSGSSSIDFAATSLNKITVLPTLDLTAKGIGVPFESAFGIDWSAVTTSAAGRSDAPFNGIPLIKATSDATNLYLYVEVLKASTYAETGYSHANQLTVYLGDAESTTSHYWQWTNKYSTYFSGWLVRNGEPKYITYDVTLAGSTSVKLGDKYYYELGIPRTLNACLAGASATVSVEANQKYVEADVWKGLDDQIGFAPTTGGEAMTITMTPLP